MRILVVALLVLCASVSAFSVDAPVPGGNYSGEVLFSASTTGSAGVVFSIFNESEVAMFEVLNVSIDQEAFSVLVDTALIPDGWYSVSVSLLGEGEGGEGSDVSAVLIEEVLFDNTPPSLSYGYVMRGSDNVSEVNVTLDVTVLDEVSPSVTCVWEVDGSSWEEVIVLGQEGSGDAVFYSILPDAEYAYVISCSDSAGNLNVSSGTFVATLEVDDDGEHEGPVAFSVTLLNGSYESDDDVLSVLFVTDADAFCELIVGSDGYGTDDVLEGAQTLLSSNVSFNPGAYDVFVRCESDGGVQADSGVITITLLEQEVPDEDSADQGEGDGSGDADDEDGGEDTGTGDDGSAEEGSLGSLDVVIHSPSNGSWFNTTPKLNVSSDANISYEVYGHGSSGPFITDDAIRVGNYWVADMDVGSQGRFIVRIISSLGDKDEERVFFFDTIAPSLSFSCDPSTPRNRPFPCTCNWSDNALSFGASRDMYAVEFEQPSTASLGNATAFCGVTDPAGNTAYMERTVRIDPPVLSAAQQQARQDASNSPLPYEVRILLDAQPNRTIVLPFSVNGLIITDAEFRVSMPTEQIRMSVSVQERFPERIATFLGEIYARFEIVGQGLDHLDSPIKFGFLVERGWLEEQDLASRRISLFRYVDDEWVELDSSVVSSNVSHIEYAAYAPGLSYFLIGERVDASDDVGVAQEPVPSADVLLEPARSTASAVPVPRASVPEQDQRPPFSAFAVLFSLFVGVLLAFVIVRRRQG